MTSTFFGLNTAMRGLRATQRAVDVANHNIANANTPGYSRQVADLATTAPYTVPSANRSGEAGQVGTGVEVARVSRARDSFVDGQLRSEVAKQGRWDAAQSGLEEVETVFNEPSDSGLNSLLSRFWGSWQTLANSPNDPSARSSLVEQGQALTSAIRYDYSQLSEFQRNADQEVGLAVDQINSLTSRIASLNGQIAQVEGVGDQANDLRDQRDSLLEELAGQVKIGVVNSPNGMTQVFLGNRPLVNGDSSLELTTAERADGLKEVRWKADNLAVTPADGRLKGLIELRDQTIPDYLSRLDEVAKKLMTTVDDLHVKGYGLDDPTGGRRFFAGSGAADLEVSPALVADPKLIATAASPNAPGDGSQALAIAKALKSGGGADEYRSLIAKLGVDSKAAADTAANQQVLVDHLTRRREAVSGVSLDEETINLLKYQQAYEASARVISTVDRMLDTLINRTATG